MAGWSEERKQAASEQAKARLAAVKAPQGDEVVKPIVTPEPIQENPVPVIAESLLEEKPDLSRLSDDDKMQSLVNLLRVLPLQYRVSYEMAKGNIWNIARFEPSEEQFEQALKLIENPAPRFPN